MSSSLLGHSLRLCALGIGGRWQLPHLLISSLRPLCSSARSTFAREASSGVAAGGDMPAQLACAPRARRSPRRAADERRILRLKLDFNFYSVNRELRERRPTVRYIEMAPLRKSVLRRCTLMQTGLPVLAIALASASTLSTRPGSLSNRPTPP
jgi:hypothetical protein